MNEKPGYRILLVDDEPLNLELLRHNLLNLGFDLFTATNGSEAVNMATLLNPDLVLLDWMMPELNGIEVVEKLKENSLTQHIPVIVMSGSKLTTKDLQTAFEAGAVDYIRHPIDPVELQARVKSMICMTESYKRNNEQRSLILIQEYELSKKNNKILELEVEKSNNQLVNYSTKVIKYDDLNKRITDEIKALQESMGNDRVEDVCKIVDKYTLGPYKVNWNEFENLFDSTNNKFFAQLANDFPPLTPHEKKLCAYYRMNLSTKEIATLTFSSHGAIRIARNRLRKKMQIPEKVTIGSFLQKY